jgi:hypothetical protein
MSTNMSRMFFAESHASTSQECQKKAADCLRLVRTLRDSTNKAMLLEMAEAWISFAEQQKAEVNVRLKRSEPMSMPNDTVINLLDWCKREREALQMQREMLQSGQFRIFETDESGQRDISNQHVRQIFANIAELDRIIERDVVASP